MSEQPSNWERMLPPCSPVVLTFAAIDTPGAYVCARTGFLLRVREHWLKQRAAECGHAF